ncbi:septum formation family protein [Microbacteriaceae bacterium VKM Ac-2855]|nr:septum formation family protein [Microbacteriaceae bacterium VKM Ac-2855]
MDTPAADTPAADTSAALITSADIPAADPDGAADPDAPAEPESRIAFIPARTPEQIVDEDPAAAAAFATSLGADGDVEPHPEADDAEDHYQWPHDGPGEDPFVWEEVSVEAEPDEDDEDEEFWRTAAGDPVESAPPPPGGFSWNLTPREVAESQADFSDGGAEFDDPAAPDHGDDTEDDDVLDAEMVDPDQTADEELPEIEVEVVPHPPIPEGEGYDEYDDEDSDSIDDTTARYAPLAAAGAGAYFATPALQHVNRVTHPNSGRIETIDTPAPRRSRRPLIITAVSVGAVLVLGALLLLGMQLSAKPASVATPVASAAATPAATPTPTVALPAVGPLPAGTYAWNQLLGGECLQPMADVWAEEFTVVDCATPHAAQLVRVAPVTDVNAFPGPDAMAASVAGFCQADGVVDIATAEALGDVQVQATYPVTNDQWIAGERDYYCFVSRAGGAALTGSLAPAA